MEGRGPTEEEMIKCSLKWANAFTVGGQNSLSHVVYLTRHVDGG